MTQYEIIIKYIESTGWIEEYRVRAVDTPWGWIGARGDRNVRDLIKKGILEKKIEGKYCWVRVKESPKFEVTYQKGYLEQKQITDSQGTLL